MTKSAGVVLLVVTGGLVGCGDSGSPVAPTLPAPTTTSPPGSAPSGPVSGESIKGTVADSAFRSLAGARVELLDGPDAGRSAITDGRGEFSMTATADDTTRFRASKDGHVTATTTVQPICDRCNPRRWVHFYLDVLDPPVPLAGNYTLTFVAAPACTNLPDELRRRSYEVSVRPSGIGYAGYPDQSATSFKVEPKGPGFPESLNWFYLNVAGTYVALSLGDHSDPGITERVSDDTYFAFGGWSTVSVQAPVSTISTLFTGWIDSCVHPAMGQRYNCTPSSTVKRVRCESAWHQLILARH